MRGLMTCNVAKWRCALSGILVGTLISVGCSNDAGPAVNPDVQHGGTNNNLECLEDEMPTGMADLRVGMSSREAAMLVKDMNVVAMAGGLRSFSVIIRQTSNGTRCLVLHFDINAAQESILRSWEWD